MRLSAGARAARQRSPATLPQRSFWLPCRKNSAPPHPAARNDGRRRASAPLAAASDPDRRDPMAAGQPRRAPAGSAPNSEAAPPPRARPTPSAAAVPRKAPARPLGPKPTAPTAPTPRKRKSAAARREDTVRFPKVSAQAGSSDIPQAGSVADSRRFLFFSKPDKNAGTLRTSARAAYASAIAAGACRSCKERTRAACSRRAAMPLAAARAALSVVMPGTPC